MATKRRTTIARTAVVIAGSGIAALCIASPASADPNDRPPVDQTRVLIIPQGLATSDKVVIEDLSNLATRCTYRADPVDNFLLPPVSRDFSMAPRGRQEFTFLAPPLGSTYHLVTSCHGNFNGQDVEVGHVEIDLPGGYMGG
jgi:hypothetical protein